MLILSFDTSHNQCSVAISKNDQIISTAINRIPSMQAEKLIDLITETLEKAQIKYSNIDFLAVTNGPGSFTGIRIGLAAASGILLAAKNIKPIILTNFDILYFRIKNQLNSFDYAIPLINAYRGQVYAQIFKNDCMPYSAPIIINNNEISSYLSNLTGHIAIGGSGMQNLIEEYTPKQHITMLPRFQYPDARTICRAAYSKIQKLEPIHSIIEPLYIRLPDAKIAHSRITPLSPR